MPYLCHKLERQSQTQQLAEQQNSMSSARQVGCQTCYQISSPSHDRLTSVMYSTHSMSQVQTLLTPGGGNTDKVCWTAQVSTYQNPLVCLKSCRSPAFIHPHNVTDIYITVRYTSFTHQCSIQTLMETFMT